MMLELRGQGWGLIPRVFREMEETERGYDWLGWRPLWSRTSEEGFYTPAIDLLEKDDRYIVKAELPGLTKDDIEVSLTDHTLTIRGERKEGKEYKEEGYYLREHTYGSFLRTIGLPLPVDEKKIEATYENGVLEVVVPKTPEVKPKKIAVASKKKELKAEAKSG